MRDAHLANANKLVVDAAILPSSEAVRTLFDQYRIAERQFRDAIVLALIGALVVRNERDRLSITASTKEHSDV